MSPSWQVVVAIGLGTILIKAAGPVVLGGRPLPPRVRSVVNMLAPALLAALVATTAFGDGQALVLDARVVGLTAGVLVLALRGPVLLVVVVAAAAAALTRLVAG